ncbi:hypothetical protein BAUCODRAFT_36938 [Baudoinia panamericana UAMH 10762]|uniref:Thioredoxin domain-containing protein n=1 Tax=Baudoinia panamericana (strain UAMH 10762) TaxID=717646 RepID=M2M9Y1_BAUPA|nr:uncharacterized protein BAUCODRAFT_36938 [Baudoinia panamericana UAMH 10762]EMC93266.1 hypothetical protein BAUCODRAFT_36938 [Baudoinia panamericana UAMH 10762]
MRASYLLRLVTATLIGSSIAAWLERPAKDLDLPKRQDVAEGEGEFSTAESTDAGLEVEEGSTFNGKHVPPEMYIEGAKLDETISSGYWAVEFFSPYCHHCRAFAPTWLTLYEFYYTQEPVAGGSGKDADISFTDYYDFHFAKVDCVAYMDACSTKDVKSFPTIKLFKDGEPVKEIMGARSIKVMSEWVEETLETIRPGSRPKGGMKVPKVGADSVEKTLMPEAPPEPALKDTDATKTASDSASTVTATRVAEPVTPNLDGRSRPLTAESFQRLVTTSRDPWFVKFYAPWCGHCQAIAPNWSGMAKQMRGQLNIGEVNCDVEKRLCKDVKVKGYPTLLFFRGGERIEYDGLRGLGDLIRFGNQAVAVAEPIQDVTAAEFEALEAKEDVLFLYFYDHATTTEDFAALERLTMSLIGHARLVTTKDPLLNDRFKISTWPRLLVSRDGKPTYYTALSPKDMRDFRRVLGWMQSVWLPIVPELTASNAREIMDGKLVVLGILSREREEEFASAKREIKNAALEWVDKQTQAFQLERQELRDAKQLRIEEAEDRNDQRALRAAKSIRINMEDIERREVGFAWVDGVFWDRWIRTTFGVSVRSDHERVVMYDYDNHRYWDQTMTGNPIVPSRTSILETLPRIVANPPKLSSKSTTTVLGHAWGVFKEQLFEHPRVSIAVAIGVAIGVLIVWRRYGAQYVRELRLERMQSLPGYFRVGEGKGWMGSEKGGVMDGLLGGLGGQQGKVD